MDAPEHFNRLHRKGFLGGRWKCRCHGAGSLISGDFLCDANLCKSIFTSRLLRIEAAIIARMIFSRALISAQLHIIETSEAM